MNWLRHFFLLPFSWVYGFLTAIRNRLYDARWLRSYRFDIPVISVGNLSMGGTGKSPHILYLLSVLHPKYRTAVLSRGYKRKTTGFYLAKQDSTAREIGDEPLLFSRLYPDVPVAVAEDRLVAIPHLCQQVNNLDVILLDDAFQHRQVHPGLNILLTDFTQLYTDDAIFPLGTLRESPSAARRADIIIVTKSPEALPTMDKEQIIRKLNPHQWQKLYFSSIRYGSFYAFAKPDESIHIPSDTHVLLLAGIANPFPLETRLRTIYSNLTSRYFSDHHLFTRWDMESILETWNHLPPHKIIVTTEKDAVRLLPYTDWLNAQGIVIAVIPIFVYFEPDEREKFISDILLYMQYKALKTERDGIDL
jgi:tetraacyldisaccharide 4'-kinase